MDESTHHPLNSAELVSGLADVQRKWVAERTSHDAALKAIKSEWDGRFAERPSTRAATRLVPSLEPLRITTDEANACNLDALYKRLQGRLRLQGLLADLSARILATAPGEEENSGIIPLEIVRSLGLDRMTLWQYEETHFCTVVTHCWQMPDQPPVPADLLMETRLPWVHGMISSGEDVVFAGLGELPPEAARDVETFRRLGCRSHVTMPLMGRKGVFGAMSFDTLCHAHRHTRDEIAEMKLVAQTFGNMIGRQRAEEKADQLRRELAHTMRLASLGGLAEGLAHELHQPLAAILSNAQAARRFIAGSGIDPDELQAILDDIVRDDKRAGGVIHHLRAMVTKHPVAREQCCLNEIVGEVLELLHAELLGKHVEVCATLAPDLPRMDSARVEMQQVLLNLVVNAVQAMKETTECERMVEVDTRLEGTSVALRIRDRGHGIPPERLAGIFDPFFTTKVDGLGMGLSICRSIVESHGGRIEARNRPVGGAEFTVLLPALLKGVED